MDLIRLNNFYKEVQEFNRYGALSISDVTKNLNRQKQYGTYTKCTSICGELVISNRLGIDQNINKVINSVNLSSYKKHLFIITAILGICSLPVGVILQSGIIGLVFKILSVPFRSDFTLNFLFTCFSFSMIPLSC